MARQRGMFNDSANYEPTISAPQDARQLVEYKADLVLEETWAQKNGAMYIYNGMFVVVSKDTDENNGLYILRDKDNFTQEKSWVKLADVDAVETLEEKINEISGGGSLDVEVNSMKDLPVTGDENVTYYVKENNSIQRWDEEAGRYISYGGTSGPTPDLDELINIINGGNANGTD